MMPNHVGIIMDGNGRWATQRGLIRTAGHKEGLKAAKRITQSAIDLEIKCLSLFVFSTENWKRATSEVSFLMNLIHNHLKKEFAFYKKNSIRVVHSGNLDQIPLNIQQEILEVVEATKTNDRMIVNLAINYGGQDEILRAFSRLTEQKIVPTSLTSKTFEKYLDTQLPPLDLVIRTAGEKRISNFLLWQSAYAEFYFSDKLWPDWGKDDLKLAIEDYDLRIRKFGGVHG